MTTLITVVFPGILHPNVPDGWTADRTRRATRHAQEAFLARHSGFGPRVLYRIVSALS